MKKRKIFFFLGKLNTNKQAKLALKLPLNTVHAHDLAQSALAARQTSGDQVALINQQESCFQRPLGRAQRQPDDVIILPNALSLTSWE